MFADNTVWLQVLLPAPDDDPVGWRHAIEHRLEAVLDPLGGEIAGGGTFWGETTEADISIGVPDGPRAFAALRRALEADADVPAGAVLEVLSGAAAMRWTKGEAAA